MFDFSGEIVDEDKLGKQNELLVCWNIDSYMGIMTIVLSQDSVYDTLMKSLNQYKNLHETDKFS